MTLAAGDSQEFFSARSLLDGSAGNTPAGVFDRHNFTNYADSRFGTLLVTNSFGLVGGRETETDDDYRFRLNLKIQSSAGANEAALRFELLQIPGIQDLVFERQAGAFIVYVYGISPNVSPGLLENVQDRIKRLARMVGKSRPSGQRLDVEPVVHQEVERVSQSHSTNSHSELTSCPPSTARTAPVM